MVILATLLRKVNKGALIGIMVPALGLIGYFGGKAGADVYMASEDHERRITHIEDEVNTNTKGISDGQHKLDHISDRVDRIYEILVERSGDAK